MRVAFSSCMSNRVFKTQPVWSWIAAAKPDHLVLLGDSLYLDVAGTAHPTKMSDVEFAEHLFMLFSELMAQKQFAELIRVMPAGNVHCIWDDHDFLWDDANGAEVHPVHTEKVRLSTAFLEAFRLSIRSQMSPGSFPQDALQAPFWDLNQPTLTTPSIALEPDLWLHLSDGRTNRTRISFIAESKRNLFGAAQRKKLGDAIAAQPAAVHLFASGSTIAGYQRYTLDLAWLKDLASRTRTLVLSGDIHRNELDAFYTGGLPLHEATSSGAAVKDGVIVGATRRNYGLLDIDASSVAVSLFAQNEVEQRRMLNRDSWLPVT